MSTTRLFVISATVRESVQSATRLSAASAMVLADKWAHEGRGNVKVTDHAGQVFSREEFRSTLWLTVKVRRQDMHL